VCGVETNKELLLFKETHSSAPRLTHRSVRVQKQRLWPWTRSCVANHLGCIKTRQTVLEAVIAVIGHRAITFAYTRGLDSIRAIMLEYIMYLGLNYPSARHGQNHNNSCKAQEENPDLAGRMESSSANTLY
jgi:hypothetical protein